MLVVLSCALPIARAQSPADARAALAPPTEWRAIWSDDFDQLELDWQYWTRAERTKLVRGFRAARHMPAVQLGGDNRDGAAELRTAPLDLADAADASLVFGIGRVDLPAGAELRVEYLAALGQWYPLERIIADGRPQVGVAFRRLPLPLDAVHDGLQLRWVAPRVGVDEAWFVVAPAVVVPAEKRRLRLDADPAEHVEIQVLPRHGPPLAGRTPFSLALPERVETLLVAPPVADGFVFSHWVLDGAAQTARLRALPVELEDDSTARAAYADPGPAEAAVWLTLRSTPTDANFEIRSPLTGQCFAQRPGGARLLAVRGEMLAVYAQPIDPRWRFVGWDFDGRLTTDPAAGAALWEADQSRTLTARFVLPGDLNGDGDLSLLDVEALILALGDPEAYAHRHPGISRRVVGDVNLDGAFDDRDIEAFVDQLLKERSPAADGPR